MLWGLGIGDWAQSPIPNPQSPIPNIIKFFIKNFLNKLANNKIYLINITILKSHIKIYNKLTYFFIYNKINHGREFLSKNRFEQLYRRKYF